LEKKMQGKSIELNKKSPEEIGTGAFRLSGMVETARTWTLQELLKMETVEVKDILVACGSGEPKGHIGQCRGILLTDIINSAKVVTTDHNDTKKMYVIASSNDGYATIFSWQEIFNTSVGEGIMVVLEKDGKPVHEESGAVDLFSARDFLTGPRYVKRLANLEIRMLG
jgi:hypothetical protein